MSALLDTSVVIDVLRARPEALSFVRSLEEPPTCSELTRVEVMRGVRSGERAPTERLLQALRWAHVDEAVARRAGELGRRYGRSHAGLGVADLVVAATALELGLPLATANVRHYPMFPELVAPYAPAP
jgi:hypothetical protein